MRKYLCLLAVLLSLIAATAQAAESRDANNAVAAKLKELRQYDAQNASLQADWKRQAARIDRLQSSVQEKQAAYNKAKDEYDNAVKHTVPADMLLKLASNQKTAMNEWQAANDELARLQEANQSLESLHAWTDYERKQKIADVLAEMAVLYDNKAAEPFEAEGNARIAAGAKNAEEATKAAALAESDALKKAAASVVATISPTAVLAELGQPDITVEVQKVAVVQNSVTSNANANASAGLYYEAKTRLKVKLATVNPYKTAAQSYRTELAALRPELVKKHSGFKQSALAWKGKLIVLRPNGEVEKEIVLPDLLGMVAGGQLHVNKEYADEVYPELKAAPFQLQLSLKLPAGIIGDDMKLEVVLKEEEAQGLARLAFQIAGQEGSAGYEYQGFTPPLITLSAGRTVIANSRLRVGETVIRLDGEKDSVVAIELKNGEIAAYSNGKLTRKVSYEGKIGPANRITLLLPGFSSVDRIKLFSGGRPILVDDFTADSRSDIRIAAGK